MERGAASRLARALTANGIQAELRDADGALVDVWVLNEDLMAAADALRARFVANPTAPEFALPVAESFVRPVQAKTRARVVDVRSQVFRAGASGMPVTWALIALSVGATVFAGLPGGAGISALMRFSNLWGREFPEIMHGQVWRLVTPIFLHGGVLHLFFNMLWLYQLGGDMERREGSLYLAAFTVVAAILVDTAEYLVSGPNFLGMSGVVYGMLGYVWAMTRFEMRPRYGLPPNTMSFMLFWLVICLTGMLGPVANTQHIAGLVGGVAFGWLRAGMSGGRRK
jgi:GlpG protein